MCRKISLVAVGYLKWYRLSTNIFLKKTPRTNEILGKTWHRHDDVIKWKHFPRYWPFVRGFHRSPVNFPHWDQWRGALMFSLMCAWTNGWVNNREAGDLRRHRANYDVTVMVRQSLLRLLSWYPVMFSNPCNPGEERYSYELKWFDLKVVHRDSGPSNDHQGVRTNAWKIGTRWFASWQPQQLIVSRIKWHHDSVMKPRMPCSIYKCNLF